MSRTAQEYACGTAVVAGIVLAYVMLALTPKLLVHHVLLLETLAGNASSIVTGGAYARVGLAPLWLVIVTPLAGIPMYGLVYWWAGRLWGDRLLVLYTGGSERRLRWIRRAERWVRRWGVWALIAGPFLPVPTVAIEVICGISGMSLGLYVIGEVLGQLLWEGLLIGLGYSIGHPAVHIVKVVGHYSLWVTIGIVVVILVVGGFRGRRAAAARDSCTPSPPREHLDA